MHHRVGPDARGGDGGGVHQIGGDDRGVEAEQIVARAARPHQRPDAVTIGDQRPRDRRADKPGGTGNEDGLGGHRPLPSREARDVGRARGSGRPAARDKSTATRYVAGVTSTRPDQ